jgi:hypothetical protein
MKSISIKDYNKLPFNDPLIREVGELIQSDNRMPIGMISIRVSVDSRPAMGFLLSH